eukprot:gb/GECG01002632.1/.p1 GENE.gb/GECG01002632.1/~~gb/GECG01002632.1/.p1  ORF type:complete len:779 (+),score=78.86 gb/GECG01002632.1/:1-2337(+)
MMGNCVSYTTQTLHWMSPCRMVKPRTPLSSLSPLYSSASLLSWRMVNGEKEKPQTEHFQLKLLSFFALICVGPAWGIMSYGGVPFIAMNGVIPFLTVGIGVDDMFILVASFNRQSSKLSTEDRIGKTMEDSGVAITITTLTDMLAFVLGIASPFRAIQIFCGYTALSILWDYILQISIFLIVLAYDADRNRNTDPCKCTRSGAGHGADEGRGTSAKASAQQTAETKRSTFAKLKDAVVDVFFSIPPQDYVGRYQDKLIGLKSHNSFQRNWFYFLVLAGYILYVCFSVLGVVNLEQGLRLAQLAPDGSHIGDHEEVAIQYFRSEKGLPLNIVVVGNVDYRLKSQRDEFLRLKSHMVDSSDLISSTDETWVDSFEETLAEYNQQGNIPEDMTDEEFQFILGKMLEGSDRGRSFRSDLSLVDSEGNVYPQNSFGRLVQNLKQNVSVHMQASKMTIRSVPLNADTTKQADLMQQSRKSVSSFSKERLGNADVFVFAEPFVFFEQFAIIVSATTMVLGTALVAMLAVALVLLPSFIATLIVVLALASIFVGVVGFMHHWGLSLNSITMVNMLMAIGFSIDFTAHMCHAFLHASGYARCLGEKNLVNRIIHHTSGDTYEASPPEVERDTETQAQGNSRNVATADISGIAVQQAGEEVLGIEVPYLKAVPAIYDGAEGLVGGVSRKLRGAQSLTNMGRPLLNGGLSTLLGVLALAGGSTFIFRAFFRILLFVLLFGMLHGVLLIPTLLSVIGPGTIHTQTRKNGSSSRDDYPHESDRTDTREKQT